MPDRTKAPEGTFWGHEIGFVCDEKFMLEALPGSTKVDLADYQARLTASGGIPELNGAPVASWLLARCANLSGKRFPFGYGDECGSDAACFHLRFLAFTKEFKPVGVIFISANEKKIYLVANAVSPPSPDSLINAFTNALFETPSNVSKCKVIVVPTDLADVNHWKQLPYVFGWTRGKYIGRTAPEHAVNPEECE